jgi:hypothetical protein
MTPSPLSESPGSEQGISRADAVSKASSYITDSAPLELWGVRSGTFKEVYALLVHSPSYLPDQTPDNVEPDRLVWGVEFKRDIPICNPGADSCPSRPGLQTIFVDFFNGELLSSSTYSPSSEQFLPTPLPD